MFSLKNDIISKLCVQSRLIK